jgi:hypothetical protein
MNKIHHFFISALVLSTPSLPLYAGDVFVVNAVTTRLLNLSSFPALLSMQILCPKI